MSLPIISADKRLAEQRGIKGCTFGKLGIGKISLLWTLPEEKKLFTSPGVVNSLHVITSGKKQGKLLSGGVKV